MNYTDSSTKPVLRKEVLVRETASGCVSLFDPLLQTMMELNSSESAEVRAAEFSEPLKFKLLASNMLESPQAKILRDCILNARSLVRVQPVLRAERKAQDWGKAALLPDIIQPQWREPLRWERLFQNMLAGRDIFMLDDFLDPDALLKDISRASFESYQIAFIQAERSHRTSGSVWDLMNDATFQSFVFALLGISEKSQHCWLHAWQMRSGDFIGLHSDGPRYQGTISIGCTKDWKAEHGGAIAFGRPREDGLDVTRRWAPQLGSVLLFAPRNDLWHVVETVQGGLRHTMTGWWTDQKPHEKH